MLLLGEPFEALEVLAFVLIWIAVLLYSTDTWRRARQVREVVLDGARSGVNPVGQVCVGSARLARGRGSGSREDHQAVGALPRWNR